ncbi:hypothetical protein H5410_040962 [Solanum commersonii]|uniref:Glycoside hydrolase family 3 N-terminal domain-containing protein n=1 Tax=Solanum commersonii TaxID=4109 RepID=A0A9J5XTG5_SOLCO|nr:hypothetical protein H5410_040962 [Solanum commersonii]
MKDAIEGCCLKTVAACAKHYVGDGGTVKGINENNTIIDRHGLLSIHMAGYYSSIIKGVSTVMVSYSSWKGLRMHGKKKWLLGFVISDWAGIDKLTYPWHTNYTYSILEGVNACIDMVSN